MPKRAKVIARELHERGLRKKLAKELGRRLAEPSGGSKEPEPEVRALAEELRRLAADVEAAGVGEHAEPAASARQAAHPRPRVT